MSRQLFTALIPVVLFWAVEKYLGLKAAILIGSAAGVAEVAWEKITTGRVAFLTLFSNAMVVGLGVVSYVMNSGVAFKLQPGVLELVMAAMMVGMRWTGEGEPFMVRTMRDSPMLDREKRELVLAQPWFYQRLASADSRLAVWSSMGLL